MSTPVHDHQYSQGAGTSRIPVPSEVQETAIPQPESTSSESEERAPSTAIKADRDQHSANQAVDSVSSRFAHDVHVYLQDLIRLADQKATFFFAGGTALLAFLYNSEVLMYLNGSPMEWNLVDIIGLVATVSIIVSVFAAMLVVVPETRGSRRGFIFWGAIPEFLYPEKYANELSSLDEKQVAQEFATHSFELANICVQKYKKLKVSVISGLIGVIALLILLLVTGIQGA